MYLLELLQMHGTPLRITQDDFYRGHWQNYLETAYTLNKGENRKYKGSTCGAEDIVAILEGFLSNNEQMNRKNTITTKEKQTRNDNRI